MPFIRSTKRSMTASFLFAVIVALVSGCTSPQTRMSKTSAHIEARDNAASLLYDLLGDEQNVSKLLVVKRERAELQRVIKSISTNAAASRKAIERMAANESAIDLKRAALPPGETLARESIAKGATGELLRASGADFEFKLLLTQAEALRYATHLARVAASHEPNPSHAKIFREIGEKMNKLNEEVLALMRSGIPSGDARR